MGPKNLYFGQQMWPKLPIFEGKQTKMHRNRLKLCINELSKFIAIYSFHLHTTVQQWDEDRDNKHEHVVPRRATGLG